MLYSIWGCTKLMIHHFGSKIPKDPPTNELLKQLEVLHFAKALPHYESCSPTYALMFCQIIKNIEIPILEFEQ